MVSYSCTMACIVVNVRFTNDHEREIRNGLKDREKVMRDLYREKENSNKRY